MKLARMAKRRMEPASKLTPLPKTTKEQRQQAANKRRRRRAEWVERLGKVRATLADKPKASHLATYKRLSRRVRQLRGEARARLKWSAKRWALWLHCKGMVER